MINKNPEALRLAEMIEGDMSCIGDAEIATELRRLHEVNIELLEALKELLRVESTHDDGEIILEVARHNARTAIAKAEVSHEDAPLP